MDAVELIEEIRWTDVSSSGIVNQTAFNNGSKRVKMSPTGFDRVDVVLSIQPPISMRRLLPTKHKQKDSARSAATAAANSGNSGANLSTGAAELAVEDESDAENEDSGTVVLEALNQYSIYVDSKRM